MSSGPRVPQAPETVVRLRGVSKQYGSTTAVSNLDLEVHAAEVLALLGPNGAGKTTTVEMCEGFVRPDAGTIEVLGLDPVTDNARLRARIGVMLQGGGGYPAARAGRNAQPGGLLRRRPAGPAMAAGHLGPDRRGPHHLPAPVRRPAATACAGLRAGRHVPSWCSSTSPPPAWTRMPGCWCGN